MSKYYKTKENVVFDTIVNLVMIFTLLVCFLPFVYMAALSFSSSKAIINNQVLFWPVGFNLDAYKQIFTYPNFFRAYGNTIFYTVFGTLFNLLLTIPAAYAMSKKRMLGRGFLSTLFLIPMYVGGGMIPTYILMTNLKLLDTRWILVISGGLSIYNMIVTRTYFQTSIPESLYEAARIDGSSELGIFFRIAIPLSMPVIAVIALYYASGHWNGYFNAMIYLTRNDLKPLQLVLRRILINSESAYDQAAAMEDADAEYLKFLIHQAHLAVTMKYSLVFIASAPMLCIYPFVQKFFVKGVMIGSIKG